MACDLCHLSTTIAPHACVQAAISTAPSPSGIMVRICAMSFLGASLQLPVLQQASSTREGSTVQHACVRDCRNLQVEQFDYTSKCGMPGGASDWNNKLVVVGLLSAWSERSRTNANYVTFLQYENINNDRHQSLSQFASRVRPDSAHGSYRNKNSLPTTIPSTHTVCRAANFPRLCCFVKRRINIDHHAPAREILGCGPLPPLYAGVFR